MKKRAREREPYGVQPHVQNLYLEDNCIISFYGLENQPKLEVMRGRERKGEGE